MKTKLTILILTIFLLELSGCFAISGSDVISKVTPAVVRIIAGDNSGSGMIIDKKGYILTNSHIIENSNVVSVILNNGQELIASVLGIDEITDLAILKISADALYTMTLGDSNILKQGDEVIAVGYPLNLEGSATITRGIVSAFRTDNDVNYIQTDAAINPGNSGGPLINMKGEVVGINSMTIRTDEELPIEGMNFAISINGVKSLIPNLISGLNVLRPITWVSYTNNTYRYSFNYPNSWEITTSGGNDSLVSVYSKNAILGAIVEKWQGSLSSWIDSKNTVDQVLSKTYLMWHSIYPSCEAIVIMSEDKIKRLSIKYNDYIFTILGSVDESEYESYSLIIDTFINSFSIIP